jgi:hypothetical protein
MQGRPDLLVTPPWRNRREPWRRRFITHRDDEFVNRAACRASGPGHLERFLFASCGVEQREASPEPDTRGPPRMIRTEHIDVLIGHGLVAPRAARSARSVTWTRAPRQSCTGATVGLVRRPKIRTDSGPAGSGRGTGTSDTVSAGSHLRVGQMTPQSQSPNPGQVTVVMGSNDRNGSCSSGRTSARRDALARAVGSRCPPGHNPGSACSRLSDRRRV